MKTRGEADQMVAEFLGERAVKLGIALTPDLDLLETRIIDSLAFMNFIMLIEEIIESPIDLDQVKLEDLRTIELIRRRFFADLPEAH